MHIRQLISRGMLILGTGLATSVPGIAFAHDNLGGDELAVSNWMLLGALLTIVLGALAAVWAARSGQFSNIEESKFRMIELSEDMDEIMANADSFENDRALASVPAGLPATGAERRGTRSTAESALGSRQA